MNLGIFRRRHIVGAVLAVLVLAPAAWAHAGPPFPLLVDQQVGPVVASVWADPDIGVGTFYITFEPLPGGAVPDDIAVDIVVQPVSKRLPETRFAAVRDTTQARVQFYAEAEFDQQEFWDVRFEIHSAAGAGQLTSQVEATPPGLGRFDLVLYLMPFVMVGGLWVRAVFRKRAIKAERAKRAVALKQG